MHLSGAIGIGLAAVVLGLVVVVLMARRAAATRDLGAMSGPWIASSSRMNARSTKDGS